MIFESIYQMNHILAVSKPDTDVEFQYNGSITAAVEFHSCVELLRYGTYFMLPAANNQKKINTKYLFSVRQKLYHLYKDYIIIYNIYNIEDKFKMRLTDIFTGAIISYNTSKIQCMKISHLPYENYLTMNLKRSNKRLKLIRTCILDNY